MIKVCLLCVLIPAFAAIAKNTVLIENTTIVSPHLEQPLSSMNVLLENGRITQITQNTLTLYDTKIDGSGKYLTPGIMDSHAHVSSIPGMGFGVETMAMAHPKLVEAYYQQQPKSFLYYGVTQVLDPNSGVNSHHFEAAAQHPDYFRCEVITSKKTFPYVEKTDQQSRSMFTYVIDENAPANAATSAETAVNNIAKSGAACIKLYFEDGYGNANQWPIFSTNTLQRIKTTAAKLNLPILAHANALDMQQLAIAAEVDVIAHGMWNWGQYSRNRDLSKEITSALDKLVNQQIGYMPTQRVIAGLGEVMLEETVNTAEFLSITPKALLDWYTTPQAQWFKDELRIGFDGLPDKVISEAFLYNRISKGNAVIEYLQQAKHPILLASDFPGSPSYANQPGLTTFLEMQAMHNAGLSLQQVLAAATINNAKQFKIDDDFGTVETGKIANLLLLNSSPLISIDAWKKIDIVVLGGKPIDRETLAVK